MWHCAFAGCAWCGASEADLRDHLDDPMHQAAFDAQFVKKPWIDDPVVGLPSVQEHPALVNMVDLTFQLSTFIKGVDDLYTRVNSNLHVGLICCRQFRL